MARGNEQMTQMLDDTVAELRRTVAGLERKLDERTAELAARNSEYGERIEQQSATIDVLKVMSASPGDPQPVFDLIVRRARDLCNTTQAALFEFDGELVHRRSWVGREAYGTLDAVEAFERLFPMVPTRGSIACRAILDRQIVHVRDMSTASGVSAAVRNIGQKSNLSLPLLRDGAAIGAVSIASEEIGGFTDSQVALLQTFAEQAVIAITSAETYRELQQRTNDLQESLEYQTATSDVLKVLSRSTFDLNRYLRLSSRPPRGSATPMTRLSLTARAMLTGWWHRSPPLLSSMRLCKGDYLRWTVGPLPGGLHLRVRSSTSTTSPPTGSTPRPRLLRFRKTGPCSA
jgi:GAF domain